MCVDYRDLNKAIIPENIPFPLIDDIMVKTRGCLWFSALDINAAFHSIPIRTQDRFKTAFITHHSKEILAECLRQILDENMTDVETERT